MAKHHNPLLLPEDVKHIRESLGMSHEDLAKVIGYVPDSIRHLESSNAHFAMSDDMALRLLDLYMYNNSTMCTQNWSANILDHTDDFKAH